MKNKQPSRLKRELDFQKLENIKLREIVEDYQIALLEQNEGTIKHINIKALLGQLNFHYLMGEIFVDIKHNGEEFRRLDPSTYNPINDLVKGLVPKINHDAEDKKENQNEK